MGLAGMFSCWVHTWYFTLELADNPHTLCKKTPPTTVHHFKKIWWSGLVAGQGGHGNMGSNKRKRLGHISLYTVNV